MEPSPSRSYRGNQGRNERLKHEQRNIMKRQFNSRILRFGASLILCGHLTNGLWVSAQEVGIVAGRTGPGAPGGFGLFINGFDVGTILSKTCDSDKDGKVTPAELKEVAL